MLERLILGGHAKVLDCRPHLVVRRRVRPQFLLARRPLPSGSSANRKSPPRKRPGGVNFQLVLLKQNFFWIADNRGVEPGGLRRLLNLKGWAASQHP